MATCLPSVRAEAMAGPFNLSLQKGGLELTRWETQVRARRVAQRKNGRWKHKCFLKQQFLLHRVKTSKNVTRWHLFKSLGLAHVGSLWPDAQHQSREARGRADPFLLALLCSQSSETRVTTNHPPPPKIYHGTIDVAGGNKVFLKTLKTQW